MIADLNKILLESLKANDSSVSLSYYVEDDGDILIEPANGNEVEIVCTKAYVLDSYTIDSIAKKINDIDCSDITKLTIRPKADKKKQVKLMRILDFSTKYRDKNYCLFKGKWASFNKSYIEFIQREIVKVNQIAVYDKEYNLTDSALEKGREIQSSDKEQYDQVSYAEYPLNIFLQNKFQYILLDRKKGQEVYKSVIRNRQEI
jgi:uncharacterized protein (TIGR04141 family)